MKKVVGFVVLYIHTNTHTVNIIICNSGDFEKTFLLAQLRSYNKGAKEPHIVLTHEAN